MIVVSEGEHKRSLCHFDGDHGPGYDGTAMASGWLQEQLGYPNFFLWIMAATIPGIHRDGTGEN